MENMSRTRRQTIETIIVTVLTCVVMSIGASPAIAASPPLAIASLSADAPISAGSGWLIWSAPADGSWQLKAYHNGTITTLPVAPRPQPFDVNVGTNAHGSPVATFSRCARTPRMQNVGSGVTGGSMLIPHSGAGCRLYMLELSNGRETKLPIPHPANASDTTPSMWHGNVAFARIVPGHSDISEVMLWSPRHPHTLQTLPQGEIPPYCRDKVRCYGQPVYGEVQALDLNADVVAFTWAIGGPGVIGHGGWEVRVDNLANAHGSLADSGFVTEACISGGVELERLEAPIAVGDGTIFSELTRSGCYQKFASRLYHYQAGARRPSSGLLLGIVLGLAKDRNALYALSAPAPNSQTDPGCSPTTPCTLEQITQPTLDTRKPKSAAVHLTTGYRQIQE